MEALELACAQPIGRVRVAWNATLGLSFIIVICAIAAAAANDADPRGNKGAGFASVWCIFVLCLVGINGAWLDREVDRDRARAAARVPVLIRTRRARATVSCPGLLVHMHVHAARTAAMRSSRIGSPAQNALCAHDWRADGQRRHDVPAVLQ